MLIQHIAIVSEAKDVPLAEVASVAAALQKQVLRDLSPIWDVSATVSAFASAEEVPIGYWLISVGDDLRVGQGVHLDKNGQPYALVEPGEHWSLLASHECLEMLVDPFGNRLVAGPSLKEDQGRVEYTVEICDPCQDPAHGYTVDGVLVSDFYTPQFFDPVQAPGVRYSFTGGIGGPRQVLPGGYLTWHDPATDHYWQQTYLQEPREPPRNLGIVERAAGDSTRAMLDRLTPEARSALQKPGHPAFAAAARARAAVRHASRAHAAAWRQHLEERRRRA